MSINVMRMFEMKSIIVKAKRSNEVGGGICLLIAAAYGHFDICRLLLDKGALITEYRRNGNTPLHIAAHYGHIEIARLLCDFEENIGANGDYGFKAITNNESFMATSLS
jgi:ankyrin repeat protein